MLDTRAYDQAVVERFNVFFSNTYWVNMPNAPIAEIRNEHIFNGTKINFPLITVRRVGAPIMYRDTNSWAAGITGDRRGVDSVISKDGLTTTSQEMTMVQSNYELTYMVDIFSLERDNFDELCIELQENLLRYPYVTFENWKDENKTVKDLQVQGVSTNIIEPELSDNTDLESFASEMPFYRATITFKIRAYIYRKYSEVVIEDFLNEYHVLNHKKETTDIIKIDEDKQHDTNSEVIRWIKSNP